MTSKRILAVLAAAILGGSLLSGTAAAEAQGGPTAGKGHCTFNLATRATKCFATYAEATAYVGGGGSAGSASAGILSTPVATVWADGAGSSPSYLLYSPNASCGYGYGNIPSYMNDRTSSISVNAGCRVNLWTDSNQGGNFEVRYGGFSWVAYNNQASSFETYAA